MGGSPAAHLFLQIVPALAAVTVWVAMFPIFVTLDPLAAPVRARVNAAVRNWARVHVRSINVHGSRNWGYIRIGISIDGARVYRPADGDSDGDASMRLFRRCER